MAPGLDILKADHLNKNNLLNWKSLGLVILLASSVANLTVLTLMQDLRDEITKFYTKISEQQSNASDNSDPFNDVMQLYDVTRDRRSVSGSTGSTNMRSLPGKMFLFQLDRSDKTNCADEPCLLTRFQSAGLIGKWSWPEEDEAKSLSIPSSDMTGTRFSLQQGRGFFYVFAHITFGPTEAQSCYNIGFSVNVNNETRIKSLSTHSFTTTNRRPPIDCLSFSQSLQAGFVTQLSSTDVVSIRTLYDRLTVFKIENLSYWGLVQLA